MTIAAICILIGIACSSPLLTFAALFQQKEWRIDRLKEHLRRDGAFNQLFGRLRPALAALWCATELALASIDTPLTTHVAWIMLFALPGFVQFALKRQRMPIWTAKAALIVALAMALDLLLSPFALRFPLSLPILMLSQPLIVLIAWALLKPVDALLKMRTMNRAARMRAHRKDATVIAVAGSVGKTTVKELIAHLLHDEKPLATPAHVNTEMGVARWLTAHRSQPTAHSSQLFIIEMGAYAKGEIALLCRIAQPTIGVMTALGSDHLALFGSEQAIIEANGELIEALPATGHAFFYGDNEGCRELARTAPCPVTLTTEGDFATAAYEETSTGLRFSMRDSSFFAPLRGRHNLHNAFLAIAVARHIGMSDARIAERLATFTPTAHTFDVREENGATLLDDTYNVSPLSMRAAIEWAGTQKHRPRIMVTSGLQETGPEEARHLHDLGAFAKGKIERVIFTGNHGADMFAAGFGSEVEILSPSTKPVEKDSTVLAVGRMPLSTVQRLLPS